MNAEGYSDWIRLVAEFTLKSLHSWKVCIYDYSICSPKELNSTFCKMNDRILIFWLIGESSKLICFSFSFPPLFLGFMKFLYPPVLFS